MLAVFAVLVILASPAVGAAEEATWVREPAISPDGSRIVFRHRADLWLVAAQGGRLGGSRRTSSPCRWSGC